MIFIILKLMRLALGVSLWMTMISCYSSTISTTTRSERINNNNIIIPSRKGRTGGQATSLYSSKWQLDNEVKIIDNKISKHTHHDEKCNILTARRRVFVQSMLSTPAVVVAVVSILMMGAPQSSWSSQLLLSSSSSSSSTSTTMTSASSRGDDPSSTEYMIRVLQTPKNSCTFPSRRGDVMEIHYTAQYYGRPSTNDPMIVYDSSAERGTGLPYQFVLGSGDMLPGVDQGLYDMCPGEIREIQIPKELGYGDRGNKLFRVPPGVRLNWTVELIHLNSFRDDFY